MSTILEDEECPYLLTNCTFNSRDYLIKMFVKNNTMKLSLIDNNTSEKWTCHYNAVYIEELTRRTGNYKKFSVFMMMLNSGLLKTNSCVRVELLSHNDLENLSEKKKRRNYVGGAGGGGEELRSFEEAEGGGCNDDHLDTRKYLILIYTVEFDKIHYPLPLEYCGMPNPRVLQKKINYLEKEKHRLEEELSLIICSKCNTELPILQSAIKKLTSENRFLEEKVKCLTNEIMKQSEMIKSYKKSPAFDEKLHLHEVIKHLQMENSNLNTTIDNMNGKLYEINHEKTGKSLFKCDQCIQRQPNSRNKRHPVGGTGAGSSRSSTSTTTTNASVKKKNGQTRKTRKYTKFNHYNNEMSSSSGWESNHSGNNQFSKMAAAATAPSIRLRPRPRAGPRPGQAQPPPLPPQPPSTTTTITKRRNVIPKLQKNNKIEKQRNEEILTPDQIHKQINELIRVVESWSTNFCKNLKENF